MTNLTDAPEAGFVQCQDDESHGWHEADLHGENQYGQVVYTVPCGGYIERYTLDVVEPALPAGATLTH